MAEALKAKNNERSAFEAAWMAHAIVDGLTPAHHYPLEAKLEELRGGEGLETRTTTKDKILLPGVSRRAQLRNNWEFWGAKGVMTTHLAFEMGVATAIAPLRLEDTGPTNDDIKRLKEVGFETFFFEILKDVASLEMYKEFSQSGWNRHIAREARDTLIPAIIRAVTLAWYDAILISQEKK